MFQTLALLKVVQDVKLEENVWMRAEVCLYKLLYDLNMSFIEYALSSLVLYFII